MISEKLKNIYHQFYTSKFVDIDIFKRTLIILLISLLLAVFTTAFKIHRYAEITARIQHLLVKYSSSK